MKTKTAPLAVKYLREGQRIFDAYGRLVGTVASLEEAGHGYNVSWYPPEGGAHQVSYLDGETKLYVDASDWF